MQSLMPCFPFQCYSGGVKKKSNPLALSVRILHTLGLSSRLRPHFHSKNSSTKTTEAYTKFFKIWDWWKSTWEPKTNLQMGKTTPLAAIQIPGSFMALTWPKRTQSTPKIYGFVPPIGCATLNTKFPNRREVETTQKLPGVIPTTER